MAGIRGARASASLKDEHDRGAEGDAGRIRGARASASLKDRLLGFERSRNAASEAHAPRPH